MTITPERDGGKLTIALKGRLNVNNAEELKEFIDKELDGVTELVFDFKELDFISSAGLRVLATADRSMSGKGTLKVINVNTVINEIFNMTGITEVLDIETLPAR